MKLRKKEINKLNKFLPVWGQLNKETKEHSLRVAKICAELAPALQLNPHVAYKIGYLHDIGKIYIPPRILKKSGKLTKIEREIIDLHSYFGYMILKEFKESNLICLSVLYHHGFNKPVLNPIPEDPENPLAFLYYSLIYVVDIYDARRHKRHYCNLAPEDEIFDDLSKDWLCEPRVLDELKKYSSKTYMKNSCV